MFGYISHKLILLNSFDISELMDYNIEKEFLRKEDDAMYKDSKGDSWYKVGLHIHTTISDGNLPPDDVAKRYKSAGFDAIAITDHWIYHEDDEIEGLKIISGCEYNLGTNDTKEGVMHILGIGMDSDPCLSKDMTRQEVIDCINNCGGLAVLAHPAWSLNSCDDVTSLTGFFGIEIYNTVSNVHMSTRPYSGYIIDVLSNKGYIFPLLATDDAHYYDGTDDTVSYIMVKAESGSREDIINAIKKGDYYSTQGPEIHTRREDDKIVVETSDSSLISFYTNSSWENDRTVRGENLTGATYRIKPHDKWVRVEVMDASGRYAWSNIIGI